MVKTSWVHIGRFILGVGFSRRFGLGVCIDFCSFHIDLGPLWFYIEW